MNRIRRSQTSRAGLIFPVSRVNRYMRRLCRKKRRLSKTQPVYLTAVLEYLTAEILELAGKAAKDNRRIRITPRHIFLAIANDEELNEMLKTVTIPQGGVRPNLHPSLLPKPKKTSQAPAPILSPTTILPISPPLCAEDNPDREEEEEEEEEESVESTVHEVTNSFFFKTPPRTEAQLIDEIVLNDSSSNESDDLEQVPENCAASVLGGKLLSHGQKLAVIKKEEFFNLNLDAVVHPTDEDYNMNGVFGQALLNNATEVDFETILSDFKDSNAPLGPESAVISPSCINSFRFLIHCSKPKFNQDDIPASLVKTIKKCFALAEEKKLKSIAFPLIGCETGIFMARRAAEILIHTITDCLDSQLNSSMDAVYIVVFDVKSASAALKELMEI